MLKRSEKWGSALRGRGVKGVEAIEIFACVGTVIALFAVGGRECDIFWNFHQLVLATINSFTLVRCEIRMSYNAKIRNNGFKFKNLA